MVKKVKKNKIKKLLVSSIIKINNKLLAINKKVKGTPVKATNKIKRKNLKIKEVFKELLKKDKSSKNDCPILKILKFRNKLTKKIKAK